MKNVNLKTTKVVFLSLFILFSIQSKAQTILYQQNFDGNNGAFSNTLVSQVTPLNGWLSSSTGTQFGAAYRHLWYFSNQGNGIFAPISGRSLGMGFFNGNNPYYSGSPFRTWDGGVQNPSFYTTRWAHVGISTLGYENITVEFKWRCTGEVGGGIIYDYGTVNTSINGGANWEMDLTGGLAGTTSEHGTFSGGLYYNSSSVQTANLTLPASRANQANFRLAFRMVVDEGYGTGGGFIVDDIIVRGTPISSDKTLTVSGAYTGASYANGNHTIANNTNVTATSGTRPGYNILGWTGTGSVPATGTGGSASFVMTQNSAITWNWQQLQSTDVLFHNYGGTEQLTFDNSRIDTTTPIFRLSHQSEEANEYEIEINSNPTFSGGTSWTQTFTGTYPVNTQAIFTFNNSFSPTANTTYYVRARAKTSLNNVWSAWSTILHSFTYQNPQDIPDWFQTTQAQFQSDVLSGVNASVNHNVVTNPGGNIIQNGSFQSGTTNWTISKPSWFTVASEAYGNTDGTHALNVYNSNPGSFGNFSGDTAGVYQAVNMTGVSTVEIDMGYESTSGSNLNVNLEVYISEVSQTGLRTGTKIIDWRPTSNVSMGNTFSVDVTPYAFTGNKLIQLVAYYSGATDYEERYYYFDNVRVNTSSQGTITSTPIHLASVLGATAYEGIKWNQTLNGGTMTLKVQESPDGINGWTDVAGHTNISATGDGLQAYDLNGFAAPHIRLVGALNGTGVTLHEWSVQFKNEDCSNSTTWDGNIWTNGMPADSDTKIIFEADYTSSGSNYDEVNGLVGCSIEVLNNVNVIFSDEHHVTIDNEIVVADTGSFTLENNASLVQINPDAENEGDIIVKKDFTFSTARNQYNFVNSPVKDQNIKNIYEGNPKAQYYNEPTNTFIFFDGHYVEGRGQALREPLLPHYQGQSDITATFEGEPANGTITLNGLSNLNNGFYLVGNPYPSQLDLHALYADNPDLEPRFLFWDNRGNPYITQQGNSYNGDHYARYNVISATGTAAAIGPGQTGYSEVREPNGLVAVGSAVMARLKEEVEAGQITLNNGQRTTEIGVDFFGKHNLFSERDRYWFTMETTEGLSIMNAVVYFEGGDDAYALDDSKTSNASDNVYTMVDDNRLSIQGKSVFEMSDSIKVGFRVFKTGNFKIKLFQTEGVFDHAVNIYLHDKVKNKRINLSEVDHYLFETVAGTFNDRFIIFYSPDDLAIPEDTLSSTDFGSGDLVAYKQGNQTVVSSSNLDLKEIAIYNIQGQLLYSSQGISGKIFRFDNAQFGKQTLLLKVKTNDGNEHYFKILTR